MINSKFIQLNKQLLLKLESLHERFEEITVLLSHADTMQNQERFKNLSKEYSELEPIIEVFKIYTKNIDDLHTTQDMMHEEDPEIVEMVKDEIKTGKKNLVLIEKELQILLLPKDPKDTSNTFLEIRAGTGGNEAAIFVGNLFRMYYRFAENQNWSFEIISAREGEHGGYREIITRIIGNNVYGKLKFESGAHRVQRVPETESQGRIHTSACTVAIMAEPNEQETIDIKKEDLRVDTFRSSGAGGQHVNTTDSAIRLTHLPTGIVVECQDERSQHKNRAKAMSLLSAKLQNAQEQAAAKEMSDTRKTLVGSGDRSERIRTYNYPQGRVTDHRINLTLYKLNEILEGDLNPIIEPLLREHQAKLLSELAYGEE